MIWLFALYLAVLPGMLTTGIKTDPDFGKTPLYFIPNQGQVNKEVTFYTKTPHYTLWMTPKEVVFDSTGPGGKTRDVCRLQFRNAGRNTRMVPLEITGHRINYFTGNDKSERHTNIKTSKAVLYKNLYKNIDLKIYGIEKQIEYDWVVKPGGKVPDIQFEYKNVKKTKIQPTGGLLVETTLGTLKHNAPYTYQVIGNRKIEVKSRFRRIAGNRYGFSVGNYDKRHELIIDPVVMASSTFLGGDGDDSADGIAVGTGGCIYVAGMTQSTDFPTQNAYRDTHIQGHDIFITKLSASGNSLLYSTYLGGSGDDRVWGFTADADGCAYVVGITGSTDFPTQNAVQNTNGGNHDGFVAKLSAQGDSLVYSTYLGGIHNDRASGIAVDAGGCAYVCGHTPSPGFPILNAFQDTHAGYGDGFIAKFSASGGSLIYSTYLGGDAYDSCAGIALDSDGCVYVTGYTDSTDLPTTQNAFQPTVPTPQWGNAFVARLSASGTGLDYLTYLGGSGLDIVEGLAVDGNGCAYVTGSTQSSDFPTQNAFQDQRDEDFDGFVTKLSAAGNSLVYSTYLGGRADDYAKAIAVDSAGCAYVTGNTESPDFPTQNAFQDQRVRYSEAFASKFSASGENLVYSTYLGDSNSDGAEAIALDGGSILIAGYTSSTAFPIQNAYQDTKAGNADAFITRFFQYVTPGQGDPEISLSRDRLNFSAVTGTASPATPAQSFSIENSGEGTLYWAALPGSDWLLPAPAYGINGGVVNVTVNAAGLEAGTYNGTITVSAQSGTASAQTVTVVLTVYGAGTTAAPFGSFETPSNGAAVSSSVPFTGWALDDVGIESVKIYNDTTYIGDAALVEGARPDVELAYPGYPGNHKAGWGYMMLTNFLPGGGNGTYTFYAVAVDLEGNEVTLGSTTITIDNADAVKPFGAIDAPAQGGTVSGSEYINSGWVLTPLPNKIPEDGSTIDVYVDGVFLGHPVYNRFREDISTLFPGYMNSGGAWAYFELDTTALSNGVHQVYWTAADDDGNADGIGSRYFTVENTGNRVKTGNREQGLGIRLPRAVKGGSTRRVLVGSTRRVVKQLERLRLELIPGFSGKCSGGQRVGGDLRSLPIGSTLDSEKGIFYWIPGPGFLGQYELVFTMRHSDGAVSTRDIRIEVEN
ncbi:MAG: hypothetical protein GY950_04610 [bacterium]|nr:hypothetical protein [bacterium]